MIQKKELARIVSFSKIKFAMENMVLLLLYLKKMILNIN